MYAPISIFAAAPSQTQSRSRQYVPDSQLIGEGPGFHPIWIWGASTPIQGPSVLLEPSGWWCLQLGFQPSVAELFRLPPLKSGTLYRNTSSHLPRCSLSGVTWKRLYYNNLSVYSTL